MINFDDAIAAKKGDAAPLLYGSDVPRKQHSIKIKVTGVRTPPKDFSSVLILDIETVFEKSAWAVNKTNAKALREKFGQDAEKMIGKSIELLVVNVNNPKMHKIVRSLFVEAPEE